MIVDLNQRGVANSMMLVQPDGKILIRNSTQQEIAVYRQCEWR